MPLYQTNDSAMYSCIYELKDMLYCVSHWATAQIPQQDFSLKIYFIWGGGCKDREMNGIKMHDVKDTKNK